MLFFERILNLKQTPTDKRRASRYSVSPSFPLKAVLNIVGCDEFGEPLAAVDGEGWDWKGRLVNFSTSGVSLQLPKATAARRGDPCTLVLSLASYQIKISCHVANVRPQPDSVLFGLKFDLNEAAPPAGYLQLLELVAFGASLKPEKVEAAEPAPGGYLIERYRGDFGAALTVWRAATGGAVEWFEFQLSEYCVRGGVQARTLEFAAGQNKEVRPVPPSEVPEVRQLFRWVVPNISRVVPQDIRHSLEQFAA